MALRAPNASVFPSGKTYVARSPIHAYLPDQEDSMIATARDFGTALARARKTLGLTQRELALSIGVGERFIVELEAGKATAQLGKALAAAKAAGMRLADSAEL